MTCKEALEKIRQLDKDYIEFKISDTTFMLELGEILRNVTNVDTVEELCKKIVSQPVYEKCEYTDDIREEDYTDYTALYDFKEETIAIYDYDLVYMYYLKDYKKTWAFSKDELL